MFKPVHLLGLLVVVHVVNGRYFITAPNVFRANVEEDVLVAIFGTNQAIAVTVKLFTSENKAIATRSIQVEAGTPKIVNFIVDPSELPADEEIPTIRVQAFSIDPALKFDKTVTALVTTKNQVVFIQTDKPIYTPDQEAKIRVISLNEQLKPTDRIVRLDIITPTGAIIERTEDISTITGYHTEIYQFSSYPTFGIWSVIVSYGPNNEWKSKIEFELREYVLPTFEVNIEGQKQILPSDNMLVATVRAKYVYNKYVRGTAVVKMSVIKNGDVIGEFDPVAKTLNVQGAAAVSIDPVPKYGQHWFSTFKGATLKIEAVVTERSTGDRENTTISGAKFVERVYTFKHDRTVSHFKKGTTFDIKIDLFHSDGSPGAQVLTEIEAYGTNENGIKGKLIGSEDFLLERTSNDLGQVDFRVDVNQDTASISITIITLDDDFPEAANGFYEFTVEPIHSATGAYLQIRVPPGEIPETQNYDVEVVKSGTAPVVGLNHIVVVRGKIVEHSSDLDSELGATRTLRIDITKDMAPSARLIIYAFVNDRVVSDSILLDIVKECKSQLIVNVNDPTLSPSAETMLTLIGPPQSRVALLAVDEAVYFLKDFHRLTRKKMFQRMETLDLGCGPGGGANSREVFENAGLIAMTDAKLYGDFHVTDVREGYGCPSLSQRRRKRASDDNQQSCFDEYKLNEELCSACEAGFVKIPKKTCAQRIKKFGKRKGITVPEEIGDPPNLHLLDPVIVVFYNCCASKEEERNAIAGRVGGDDEIEIDESSDVGVRSNFPETWIFEEYDIPDSGQTDVPFSVPDSITNWIVQASSVSAAMGMCVADEKEIEVSKDVFLQLKIPYSVVKGEQTQVKATLFNYGSKEIQANVYMYGTENVCSNSLPGIKGPKHRLTVQPNDASTTFFNIIPIKEGLFPIDVKSFTSDGNDGIRKFIRVVAEGVERYNTVTILIDPAGERKGVAEEGENEEEDQPLENELNLEPATFDDDEENKQTNIIDIQLADVNAIPGTEKCFITFFGDLMSPSVSAIIDGFDPFSLFETPNGCGEQTMKRMSANVYTMVYLSQTDRVTSEVEERGFALIKQSYERMITFQLDNGGITVWVTKPASIWLTSYSIKVFYEVLELGGYVDKEKLCEAYLFLGSSYEDVGEGQGKFQETYNAHHQEMIGGISGDLMMTAFVMITIIQSNPANIERDPLACNVNYDDRISKAVAYLEANINALTTPYHRIVAAYALSVAESDMADVLWAQVKLEASFDPVKGTRHWLMQTSTLTIEATGYALMAAVYRNEVVYANGMVNWLTEHGDYKRGWSTTSSTGIALEALATYATHTDTASVSINCKVSNTGGDAEFSVDINEEKKDLSQQIKCKVNGKVVVDCTGTGVAQAQVEVIYNSPASDKESECDFFIDIASKKKENDQQAAEAPEIHILTLTTKYRRELNGKTNMAIVDIGLISGYTPVESTLKTLVNSNAVAVDRYEIADRKVVFYLQELTSEFTVLRFEVVRSFEVLNVQAAQVSVYDYYSPEKKCRKFYNPHDDQTELRQFCEEDLCQCAAGACPKCPRPTPLPTPQELEGDYACGVTDKAMDYVYETIAQGREENDGFVILTGSVITVIKEGTDEISNVPAVRLFVMKSSCVDCKGWKIGQKYLIMGKDGIRYKPEGSNVFVFKYLLDSTSYIEEWPTRNSNKKRAKELKRFKDKLVGNGCSV
ncbi:complement C3-like [Antedon mediterranea]|uniref:complement C3-like n=1 Tax=Antedon mediterranea TaxID=105859 RepID=UPI003AF4F095